MFPRIIQDPKKLLTLMTENFNETLIVKIHLFQLCGQIGQSYPVSEIFDWILSQPNHKFILLERNFLNSYISLLKAEQSNKWHHTDTTNIQVEVDLDKFDKELTRYTSRYDFIKQKLQEHRIDYLSVDYDRDLKNYNLQEFQQLIEPWLARQQLELTHTGSTRTHVQKQNTDDDISNSISNWTELAKILR
jgi:AAA+ ATPase superfamily predicted ATPase